MERNEGSKLYRARALSPGASGRRDEPDLFWWQRALSASVGSVLTSLFMTPFDVVKVRLQSQQLPEKGRNFGPRSAIHAPRAEPGMAHAAPGVRGSGSSGVSSFVCPVNRACRRPSGVACLRSACPQYVWFRRFGTTSSAQVTLPSACVPRGGGMLAMGRSIVQREGVLALWSGLTPAFVMAVPSTTMYMVLYDELRIGMQKRNVLSGLEPFVAGAVARTAVVVAVAPLELVRTRMQSAGWKQRHSASGAGLISSFRRELRTGGFSSMYRGVGPTLFRDVPYSALYWLMYERLRRHYMALMATHERQRLFNLYQQHPTKGENPLLMDLDDVPLSHTESTSAAFLAGGTAGAIAGALFTPFDVAKTRRQVAEHSSTALPKSTPKLLHHIFRTEGIAGLYAGIVPRVLRVAPASAIMISTYELGKRVFRESNDATP